MDVILLERIDKLGQMGDVVKGKKWFYQKLFITTKKSIKSLKG